MAEQYQKFPQGLSIYVGSCLVEAIDDWAAGFGRAPADLYERFLGWTDKPPPREQRIAA
ncbi:hypothetical protein [Actinoplanes sp. NPDC051851]|uniref:hypothetical protein n=1 Tax=Actinoplanes sp. NPDC051851 TaxID=3154753 RepID=UPI00344A0928